MSYQAPSSRLVLLALCTAAGCTLPTDKRASDAFSEVTPPAAAAEPSSVGAGNSSTSASSGSPTTTRGASQPQTGGTSAAPDPRVLSDVLSELAELGPIQPEAQQRLIDNLRKTDPAYWPMLVQTFRASLAYRRRAAEREAEATSEAVSPPETNPEVAAQQAVSRRPESNPSPPPAIDRASFTAPADAATQPSATSPPLDKPADANRGPGSVAALSPATNRAESQANWRQQLSATIGELERETQNHPQAADALDNQVYLRLLDVVVGRTDDALRPIPGLSPGEQDYWSKQLFALSTYLDRQRISDPARRASEASLQLSKAMASLGEQGSLLVRNLTFCTEVRSYGVLNRFETSEFKPGQSLLLYAEIENFKSEQTAQGFHTCLDASYQILDSRGQRVARDDLRLTEEDCQNHRRDFFVSYLIVLPKTIYEGAYTLELTMEDKLARKIGQSRIEFTVKEKRP
jgi:hypothetical protein